jgi:GR25 family glycosyltransferase involved in LPS biosynthesis
MKIRVTRFTALDTKPGWVGCAMSHLTLMEQNKNEDRFAIYEDDVKFLHRLELVHIAMLQLPDDWDCLYLGASPKEPQQRYSGNLFRLKNAHVTHAIIWHNRKGGVVEYILSHSSHIRKYDDYLATVIQPQFNCFVTYPMIATQQTIGNSDTCTRNDLSTIIKNYNKFCI